MKQLITALYSGILFGVGLAVSGMTDTRKVIGFLDTFGDWQPELLVVMSTAFVVTGIGYKAIFRLKAPIFSAHFSLPERTDLDKPLIIGAILFGMGWGLYGYCPGPAIASLSYGYTDSWVFLLALIVGIKGYDIYQAKVKPV